MKRQPLQPTALETRVRAATMGSGRIQERQNSANTPKATNARQTAILCCHDELIASRLDWLNREIYR